MGYAEQEALTPRHLAEIERLKKENAHLKFYKTFYEKLSKMIRETDRVNVQNKLISSRTLINLVDFLVPEIGTKKDLPIPNIDQISFRI